MNYINRHLYHKIKKLFSTYKVVLITGSRQVGKTRLIKEKFGDIKYISLDDYELLQMAKNDGRLFLENNGIPLVIDEAQRAPELFRTIKLIVDRDDKYGQYILSGSQLFKLMNNVSDSLAGRIAIVELPTLSAREIMNIEYAEKFLPTATHVKMISKYVKNIDFDVWEIMHKGMYPELQNNDKNTNDYYKYYIATYLERDVREIINVQNIDLFYKFMVSVASRTGQLVNYTSIGSEVGVDADTIKKWISVLETSNLIYILKPYANKELKRTLKTSKLYFRDVGLCAYLTRWITTDTLKNGAMSGAFFETYVISEIIKSYENNGLDYDKYLSFYNGYDNTKKTQSEIDLIIEENDILYPVEIKTKSNPNIDDIENFSILQKIKNKTIGEGAVICDAFDAGFITNNINIIPVKYI